MSDGKKVGKDFKFLKAILILFSIFFGGCLFILGSIIYHSPEPPSNYNQALTGFIFVFITLGLITIVLIYLLSKLTYLYDKATAPSKPTEQHNKE
jgi:uncharacterized membrane protein (DUF373 family)